MEREKSKLVDTKHIYLVQGNPEKDHWLLGRLKQFPGYSFAAKVYDAPSTNGIKDGRVSKLSIYRDADPPLNGKLQRSHTRVCVAHFDRGWDQPPQTAEIRSMVDAIDRAFPCTEADRQIGRDRDAALMEKGAQLIQTQVNDSPTPGKSSPAATGPGMGE